MYLVNASAKNVRTVHDVPLHVKYVVLTVSNVCRGGKAVLALLLPTRNIWANPLVVACTLNLNLQLALSFSSLAFLILSQVAPPLKSVGGNANTFTYVHRASQWTAYYCNNTMIKRIHWK